MKIQSPYRCDFCPTQKGENNHWFLVYASPERSEEHTVKPWSDDHADDSGVQHACSEQCVAKSLNKWFADKRDSVTEIPKEPAKSEAAAG